MSYLQLTYISTEKEPFSEALLGELMRHSRRNNKAHELTGLLLYDSPRFIQVIEGPEANLRRVFAAIAADERHRNLELLCERTIHEREFAQWRMGLGILGQGRAEDLARIDTRLRTILRGVQPTGDDALVLLRAFRDMEHCEKHGSQQNSGAS